MEAVGDLPTGSTKNHWTMMMRSIAYSMMSTPKNGTVLIVSLQRGFCADKDYVQVKNDLLI